MSRLDKLADVSSQVLYGLTADQALKHRILEAAAAPSPRRWFRLSPRLIPLICVTAGIVMIAVGIAGFHRPSSRLQDGQYFTSATHTSVSPILLRSFLAEGISD